MRRFLSFLELNDGWLCEDSLKPPRVTIARAAKLGWADVRYCEHGTPIGADITPLGRAALRWGVASYVQVAA